MKKFILVSLTLLITMGMVLVMAAPAAACYDGRSPGYWKNHFPSAYDGILINSDWNASSPSGLGAGPDKTLLEALKTGGGGEAAFLRQAVAQYLNIRVLAGGDGGYIAGLVQAAYGGPGGSSILASFTYAVYSYPDDIYIGDEEHSLEWWKNYLEKWNSK